MTVHTDDVEGATASSNQVQNSLTHSSSSCFQALKSETLGKVTNFQAIPGCGLICQVTNVYNLVDGSSSQVDLMNMRNAIDEYAVTIDGVTLSESSTNTSSIGTCDNLR